MSMLLILTTSCTDLTEDLVPNTTENTELTMSVDNTIPDSPDNPDNPDNGDTGGVGDGDGDNGKDG